MNHRVLRGASPPLPALWPHRSYFLKERVFKQARRSTSGYNGDIMNTVASGIYHSSNSKIRGRFMF